MNLLSNAVLHTDAGLIHVEINLCAAKNPEEPPHRMLEFKVRDTGEGINPLQLESIYDPFTSYSGSVGLGLFLVKQQAATLGGSCGVESELGQGTVAWFRVPYILPVFNPQAVVQSTVSDGDLPNLQPQPNPTLDPPPDHATEKAAVSAGIKMSCEQGPAVEILLVDDVLPTQRLHALALEACGYVVELACNANEGFARMTQKKYTLVLCDIYMRPGRSGLELTSDYRKWEAIHRANKLPQPIMGLSASLSTELPGMCIAAGMQGVLEKPMDLNAVHSIIQTCGQNGDSDMNADQTLNTQEDP